MFTETKLLGWVRMIVLNILQKSTDIRLKLIDWDRPLGVWNIWTPGNKFRAIFTRVKLVGWVRVIVWNTFQMSKHIRVT